MNYNYTAYFSLNFMINQEVKGKEQEIEMEVNELDTAELQEPIQITEDEVRLILRNLKKRKEKDAAGWVNEMLIY